jgi:hypothetical protein
MNRYGGTRGATAIRWLVIAIRIVGVGALLTLAF